MHASISWPAPASRIGLPAFPTSGAHRRYQARVQDVRRWPNHVCNLKEELNRLRGVRLRDVAQLQSAAAAGQTMPLAGGGKWWGATPPSSVHLDRLAMNRGIAGGREQASRTTFTQHAAGAAGTADRSCTAFQKINPLRRGQSHHAPRAGKNGAAAAACIVGRKYGAAAAADTHANVAVAGPDDVVQVSLHQSGGRRGAVARHLGRGIPAAHGGPGPGDFSLVSARAGRHSWGPGPRQFWRQSTDSYWALASPATLLCRIALRSARTLSGTPPLAIN